MRKHAHVWSRGLPLALLLVALVVAAPAAPTALREAPHQAVSLPTLVPADDAHDRRANARHQIHEFLGGEDRGQFVAERTLGERIRRRAELRCELRWIVLGEVTALHREDDAGDPLLFFSGAYRQLADKGD